MKYLLVNKTSRPGRYKLPDVEGKEKEVVKTLEGRGWTREDVKPIWTSFEISVKEEAN